MSNSTDAADVVVLTVAGNYIDDYATYNVGVFDVDDGDDRKYTTKKVEVNVVATVV